METFVSLPGQIWNDPIGFRIFFLTYWGILLFKLRDNVSKYTQTRKL